MKSQKAILKTLNKKQKESLIKYGYYVMIFFLMIMLHKYLRWNHYNDNTIMSSKIVEKSISYDDIHNPDPNRYYFRKIEKIKTIRATGFMKVETIRKENNKGTWSREK